jgi:hypothetical protein
MRASDTTFIENNIRIRYSTLYEFMMLKVSLLLSMRYTLKRQCSGFKNAGRPQSVAGYILNHPPSMFKLRR